MSASTFRQLHDITSDVISSQADYSSKCSKGAFSMSPAVHQQLPQQRESGISNSPGNHLRLLTLSLGAGGRNSEPLYLCLASEINSDR